MPEAYPSIDPQSAAANIHAFRQQALQFKQQQVESQLLGALLNAEPENRGRLLAESMKEEKPSLLNNLLQIPTKQQMLMSSPTVRSLMGQMMGQENPDDPYAGLTEEERQKAVRIKAGLMPRAVNQTNNLSQPYEATEEEKAYESDMKTMNNENTPQAIKRTARQRLSQNPMLNGQAPETDFSGLMSEMPKTKRVDAPWYSPFTFDDDVYGEDAYNTALDKAIIEGAAKGYSVNSIKKRFDEFWDSKYKAEKGQRYQKYAQRPQDITSPARAKDDLPDEKLTPYWGQLNDEAKQQVKAAIKNGYSIEEIIDSIKE